jgi:hypothetical protein
VDLVSTQIVIKLKHNLQSLARNKPNDPKGMLSLKVRVRVLVAGVRKKFCYRDTGRLHTHPYEFS